MSAGMTPEVLRLQHGRGKNGALCRDKVTTRGEFCSTYNRRVLFSHCPAIHHSF